ncbi:MmgE/PrpD family protein [Rhizorhabdus phycosphaerae]|uniref:MmgE/PrpD family protein n=1 Tax=Rhizorhabdus phycosphaerae TaxID=2711156 RepID=UPI0013ECF5D1|nr:MmgE/PrpD family protein [Rhizorhabdus phycosphaerae]
MSVCSFSSGVKTQIKPRTKELASFAATLPSEDIPANVTARALDLTIDLIGSAVRAARDAESTPAILATVHRLGLSGDPLCTVFGLDRRYGPAAAALLNGAFGHSLDFDDTHADSSLHPSAPVVPAALAAAQMTGATGAELLTAIVIGYEVCCRLGNALDPTAHYARGFHPTATAGVFGACAAAGRLLKLDDQAMVSAFGIAASQASGSLQFLANGAWNKRYQVGEAAMKGIIAATLASEGFVGADDGIDGKHGFLSGYSDASDPELAVAGLGHVWETTRIGVKPYPACRYTHAAVDGLLNLMRTEHISPAAVKSVTVGLHSNGITLVGAPMAKKRRPRNIVQGQFSMPFAAAVTLLRGRFGWDDYELLGRPEVDAICDRIFVKRDTSLENAPHPFGATLEVEVGAHRFHRTVADPSGEPATFPTQDQIADKFLLLTQPVLGSGGMELLEKLRKLPSTARIGQRL